jgi:hypothetical protein
VLRLHDAEGDHGTGDAEKPGDVRAFDVVARGAELLGGLVAEAVDAAMISARRSSVC